MIKGTGYLAHLDSVVFRVGSEFYTLPTQEMVGKCSRDDFTEELAQEFVESGKAQIYKVPHL